MFDPVTFERKRITVDLDFSSFEDLRKWLRFCMSAYFKKYPIRKITVWTSALKGFHAEIWFISKQNVAMVRNDLKDDGIRLVKDIFRSHDTHDVLWTFKQKDSRKHYKSIIFLHENGKNIISNLY